MESKKAIQRLKEFIDFKGISMNAFDASIGASNGYIGRMIKNNASIGSDVLEKIFCIYPELNLIWLIVGEGDMTRVQNIIQGDRNPVGNNQGTISGHNIGDNSINISGPKSGKQKIIHPDRTVEIDQFAPDYISGVSESQASYLSESVRDELTKKDKEISLLKQQVIDLQSEIIMYLTNKNK